MICVIIVFMLASFTRAQDPDSEPSADAGEGGDDANNLASIFGCNFAAFGSRRCVGKGFIECSSDGVKMFNCNANEVCIDALGSSSAYCQKSNNPPPPPAKAPPPPAKNQTKDDKLPAPSKNFTIRLNSSDFNKTRNNRTNNRTNSTNNTLNGTNGTNSTNKNISKARSSAFTLISAQSLSWLRNMGLPMALVCVCCLLF